MLWPLRNRQALIFGIFFILCIAAPVVQSFADEENPFHHRKSGDRQPYNNRSHHGGELGGLAAWLFALANFPVVLSLVLKGAVRILQDGTGRAERIRAFNLRQKKYLMNLHYWVNPVALGIAIVHFLSSECRSTTMPELGMGAILMVSLLGAMMTLKVSPVSIRRFVFKLHTNPLVTILVFSILLIGHSVID